MTVLRASKGGKVHLHYNATANAVVQGNSSVSALAVGREVVANAAITKVMGYGSWAIARGANNIMTVNNYFNYNFAEFGSPLNKDSSGDIVLTLTGSGFIMLEVNKGLSTTDQEF